MPTPHSPLTVAYRYARNQFKGATRMDGSSKIDHSNRVAMTVVRNPHSTETQQIAAMLHDVVEDTDATIADIHNLFGHDVAQLVAVLTHIEGESYVHYIDGIAANPQARIIKQADLTDNLSTLPFGDRRWSRYLTALVTLNAAGE
jgi:(p)ppGpp synthase/HD superfamily hydrolase